MKIVHKHFLRHNKYYKLFKRNNIKLSYSCMPSMNNVIRKHNSEITKTPAPSTTKSCNGRRKTEYSLDGSYLSECLIYQASASATTNKYYYDSCENTLKKRYNNHNCSFRDISCEINTELTKHVWEVKEKGINYFIDWDIAIKLQKYVCGSGKFNLCIFERLFIRRTAPNFFLNKREGLVSEYRHRDKFTLKCCKAR